MTKFFFFFALLLVLSNAFHFSQNNYKNTLSRFSLRMDGGRVPLIAGNWKMNTDLKSAVTLATELASLTKTLDSSKVEIAVVPPFPFLTEVSKALSGSSIAVGAQTSYQEVKGAFTGAISAGMIASCGCKYCLVGHSERRKVFKETDADFNLQLKKVLEANLTPILCVGETEQEYKLGLNVETCTIQLAKSLLDIKPEDVAKIVIAYEPVWAIGTGLTATPAQAQNIHSEIRKWLKKVYGNEVAEKVRIQYGGSVTADNVDELMRCPDIDGALVGGASLTAESFARIASFK